MFSEICYIVEQSRWQTVPHSGPVECTLNAQLISSVIFRSRIFSVPTKYNTSAQKADSGALAHIMHAELSRAVPVVKVIFQVSGNSQFCGLRFENGHPKFEVSHLKRGVQNFLFAGGTLQLKREYLRK